MLWHILINGLSCWTNLLCGQNKLFLLQKMGKKSSKKMLKSHFWLLQTHSGRFFPKVVKTGYQAGWFGRFLFLTEIDNWNTTFCIYPGYFYLTLKIASSSVHMSKACRSWKYLGIISCFYIYSQQDLYSPRLSVIVSEPMADWAVTFLCLKTDMIALWLWHKNTSCLVSALKTKSEHYKNSYIIHSFSLF